MAPRSQRYSVRICDRRFDYDIQSQPPEQGLARWQVNAAVRGEGCRLHGSDLRMQVLDQDFEPLSMERSSLDHVWLPHLEGDGRHAAFKSVACSPARPESRPAFLSVVLGGHPALLPLLLADAGGEDDQPPDPAPAVEMPFDAPAPEAAPPAPDEPIGVPDSRDRCCPVALTTPEGNLDHFAERDGVGVTFGVHPWSVEATFTEDGAPCACYCCQYRQEVKGHVTLVSPAGLRIPTEWPLDYEPVEAGDPWLESIGRIERTAGGFRKMIGLDPDTYRLDGAGDPDFPGRPILVGKRDPLDGSCQWRTPHGKRIRVTGKWKVEVDVSYRGYVIDVCRDGARRTPFKEWTWKQEADFLD